MTGHRPAIGFLFTWVFGFRLGGSLIDAGLINVGGYALKGGQIGTATISRST